MAPGPLITIGITAYNEGAWLQECWESVVAQNSQQWQSVMVLDGGADKKTKRIFKNISHAKLKKIELTENSGPYPARTEAIKNAETPWYFHVDADDRLPVDAVEKLSELIANNPGAEYIAGDCLMFGIGQDRVIPSEVFDYTDQDAELVLLGTSPIRVSLFRKVGGFEPALYRGGADFDFWVGVAELEVEGARVEEVIYERRNRKTGNVGTSWALRKDKVADIILKRHPKYFSAGQRKRRYLRKNYYMMARTCRAAKRYALAAGYAEKALEYGCDFKTVATIIREKNLPRWRIYIRFMLQGMKSLFK
ncbi:glycosyltransferase family A protein [Fibrobacterota bacterium]